ncbi:MAG: diadenylate cyclase [Proteobacteria bacterium]|nr:diadenylate cyclase [Pseudomonadota bacterium]
MDKKRLIDKIVATLRLSVEADNSVNKYSCGEYSFDDFESYWDKLLSDKNAHEMEYHCLICPLCILGLAKSWEINEKAMNISNNINNEELAITAANFIENQNMQKMRHEYLWAAAENHSGGQGEALGVAIAGEGEQAALIECNAWVGNKELSIGKLELWGMQVEGTGTGVPITQPLKYLEDKLEGIFRVNSLFQAFNLDRRYINVDLKERVLKEANSLSLAIIMSIVNAACQRTDDPNVVYSADIRQDGKLEKVGMVSEKLRAARNYRIKQFVLSKENELDCSVEFLSDPNFQVLFFDSVEEVLQYFGVYPASFLAEPKVQVESHELKAEKHDKNKFHPLNLTPADESKEWHFILKRLEGQGIKKKVLEQLLPFFEDLCQAMYKEGTFSTVFFMGLPEKIHCILPYSGFEFVRRQPLLEFSGNLLDLISLINGRDLGFVIDYSGLLVSIRKVNAEILGRQDIGTLLMGANRQYAYMSLFSQSLIFFFPPSGRHLHIFFDGNLIGKYMNGRWRETDYVLMDRLLEQVSEKNHLSWPDVRKAARAAVSMAERGQGGIFAFVKDTKEISGKWEDRLETCWGLKMKPIHVSDLNEKDLINQAKDEGAVIIDRHGKIISCRAYIATDISESEKRMPGTSYRHKHARHFSEIVGVVTLVASRYGKVTVYERGEEIISL